MSDPKMCVWCGEPATEQVTVEPARYRKTMVVDPQSGSRIPGQQLIQAAIVVDVCAARAQRITESGTPPRSPIPRRPGTEQTTIFDALNDSEAA